MNDLVPVAPDPEFLPAIADARPSLVESWLGDKSPETRRAYLRDLRQFADWLDPSDLPTGAKIDRFLALPAGVANEYVLSYRNTLISANLSSATINRRLAAIRSAVKLARTLGLVNWSIEIAGPKPERREDRSGPDAHQRKRLWKWLRKGDTPVDRRDRAIFALLFDLALRRNEVVTLSLMDLDITLGTISVLRKGRRERVTLAMPPATRRDVEAWVAVRGQHDGPLFTRLDRGPGHTGGLSGEGLRLIVKRAGLSAGVNKPLRPHGLRHAAATHADGLGKSPVELKEFLGHSKIETTMGYIDRAETKRFGVAESVSKERGK